jgi:hypothetical protein
VIPVANQVALARARFQSATYLNAPPIYLLNYVPVAAATAVAAAAVPCLLVSSRIGLFGHVTFRSYPDTWVRILQMRIPKGQIQHLCKSNFSGTEKVMAAR